jgi:hypothetical protein
MIETVKKKSGLEIETTGEINDYDNRKTDNKRGFVDI